MLDAESGALEQARSASEAPLRLAGRLALLLAAIARAVADGELDRRMLVKSLYETGVRSLPIVVLTALFTGGIMVVQAAPIVERYGAHGLLGWGAGFGTLR
ncbi:MAG TPA: ABC transporter permease, partial [Polyangiaceae bacterium]|nr:ABC transporter permease [Polyangiaceae bacterium]